MLISGIASDRLFFESGPSLDSLVLFQRISMRGSSPRKALLVPWNIAAMANLLVRPCVPIVLKKVSGGGFF